MEKDSLGLIETVGLVGAIEAADAGSKAANVTFRGYERGLAGLITVVFAGDVAAVRAAVAAGTAAAKRVGKVVAVHVIARPDRQVHVGSPNGHESIQLQPPAPQETVEVAAQRPAQETAEPERVAKESAPHEEPVRENHTVTAVPTPDEISEVSATPEYSAIAVAEAEKPVASAAEDFVSPEPAPAWEEAIPTGGNGDSPAPKAKATGEVTMPDTTVPARKKERIRPTKAKKRL